MRAVTIGLINIDQAELTIDMLEKLSALPPHRWSVQLVLVDNGSTGADVRRLRQWIADEHGFDDTVFLATGENLGAAAGRNLILSRADGSRTLILDNDLVLADGDEWLDGLWSDLDEDDELAIAGPMLVFAKHPEITQAAGIGLTRMGRVGYLHRGDLADQVPTSSIRVIASPAACWLMSAEAQRSVGLFPEIYHPMQYWDVDYCMQLREAGLGVLCDRAIRLEHIANVTTRAGGESAFARTAVRHGMLFRERWYDDLAQIDVIEDKDIYWGPIPRP